MSVVERPLVLIVDSPFTDADVERSILAPLGADVVEGRLADPSQIGKWANRVDALLSSYLPLGEAVVEQLQRCRIIARYGIGVDNISISTATRRGIVVTNVPDYCIDEVADHTIALLLAASRKIVPLANEVTAGGWDWRVARPSHRLRGQIIGLVGFGRIGRAVAHRARAFGLQVYVYDPYVTRSDEEIVIQCDLADLLAQADFVSLHLPLSDATRGFIGESELRKMKSTSVLINASRGPLIQEQALARALREGWIAGAALDVMEHEPPIGSPLLGLPNLLLTPHAAWYSEEAMIESRRSAAEEVARVLSGRPPRSPVNPVVPDVPARDLRGRCE